MSQSMYESGQRFGELLISRGLASPSVVSAALEKQRRDGGRLGDILISMGKMSSKDVHEAMRLMPAAPNSIEETGIDATELVNLFCKTLLGGAVDTVPKASDAMKLPQRVTQKIVELAADRGLIEMLGTGSLSTQLSRYALTQRGREWATQTLESGGYVGPAPVRLSDYVDRVRRQAIGDERVTPEAVHRAMQGLVMPGSLADQIGPAVNSGKSILLYGPPGNGKTSIAQRIGAIFQSLVYVPYAVEVGGHIIKVFDEDVHQEAVLPPEPMTGKLNIRTVGFDARWVPCRRPFIVTGGELTLAMLDLQFNSVTKLYEAPLHMKALNGVFVVDDFGRQIVQPETLLNRWIVPLENKVDYLTLHTGKTFQIPFDELVIFSTNMPPSRIMDAAFLRRIPFKIEIGAPESDAFRQIFHEMGSERGLETSDEMVDFIIKELTVNNDFPLAGYQSGFVVNQLLAVAKYRGAQPRFDPAALRFAIANLFTHDHEGYRGGFGG